MCSRLSSRASSKRSRAPGSRFGLQRLRRRQWWCARQVRLRPALLLQPAPLRLAQQRLHPPASSHLSQARLGPSHAGSCPSRVRRRLSWLPRRLPQLSLPVRQPEPLSLVRQPVPRLLQPPLGQLLLSLRPQSLSSSSRLSPPLRQYRPSLLLPQPPPFLTRNPRRSPSRRP